MHKRSYLFKIADFHIRLDYRPNSYNYIELLPSFQSFIANEDNNSLINIIYTLTVDNSFTRTTNIAHIKTIDTGNGDTIVNSINDAGYQFIIKNLAGEICCILETDDKFKSCKCGLYGTESMRRFGLNDALMMGFAFAASHHNTLLIHASCIKYNNKAYAFIAKSGTGKSTHSSLWLNHIPGTELINDDNPIIKVVDNREAFLYGSPWSGKTTCYRNTKVKLGALVNIQRDKENSITKLNALAAFSKLLPACSTMKWDKIIYNNICATIGRLIETTSVFTLNCLPNKEAAELCQKNISNTLS